MKTEEDTYFPIHEIASFAPSEICCALLLFHSLKLEKYQFFTGRKAWLPMAIKTIPLDHIASFVEDKE